MGRSVAEKCWIRLVGLFSGAAEGDVDAVGEGEVLMGFAGPGGVEVGLADVFEGAYGGFFISLGGLMICDAVVGFGSVGFKKVHYAGEGLNGGVMIFLGTLAFGDSEECLGLFLRGGECGDGVWVFAGALEDIPEAPLDVVGAVGVFGEHFLVEIDGGCGVFFVEVGSGDFGVSAVLVFEFAVREACGIEVAFCAEGFCEVETNALVFGMAFESCLEALERFVAVTYGGKDAGGGEFEGWA